MKKCVLCGKMFEPKKNAQRICDDIHYRTCKFCGNQFEITRPSDSKQCCSKECTKKLREQTMLAKYGVKHALESKQFIEKSEATQLARYGVKHAAQNEEIKKRTQDNFEAKYGVKTPFQLPDFQKKSTETCLKRYGVAFTSQIPGRTEKMRKTNIARYGSEYPLGNKKIANAVKEHMQDTYGVPYYCMTQDCKSKQKNIISTHNKFIIQELSKLGVASEPEQVVIDNYSYDIYVPSLDTVIEVNPTDTHNTVCNPWSNTGLDKMYHRRKTQLAVDSGYRCINIWDWDNVYKVINMLQPKQTIYARNCNVRLVDPSIAHAFENMYHLQNSVRGQVVCIGLYLNEDLVQLMTFGKPRYNKKYQWELLRLCSNSIYAVVGGAEKLWTYFIRNFSPDSIISYCDLSKFTGSVYTRLGMKLDYISDPAEIWSKGSEIITSNLLRQRGYDQLFGTSYGKGTSNSELMLEHGWLPVYDCGQAVYVYMN